MPRKDLYVMDMNKGRICYNCGGFRHNIRHFRERENQGRVRQGRRVNYENNQNRSNLNREENLIVLN